MPIEHSNLRRLFKLLRRVRNPKLRGRIRRAIRRILRRH